ncbi:imidazoleglycerol-phosphate dehydratase HisB [Candidatus Micrarchaeota archaeon]|nr:imidazoleglycerol-phosphate dehydratase HisB [Candidatus Micrarchaeota archaeon]
MNKRITKVGRKTRETEVNVELNIDGEGEFKVDVTQEFFKHMLETFTKQGMFDLKIKAGEFSRPDDHHLVEDVGLVLGEAFKTALGEKRGINRYGFFILPMDDALALISVDLGGRPFCSVEASFEREKVGEFSTELVYDFFKAFSDASCSNVQVILLRGRNDHHKIEAIFKAFGRAMRMACERNSAGIPSTKGVL